MSEPIKGAGEYTYFAQSDETDPVVHATKTFVFAGQMIADDTTPDIALRAMLGAFISLVATYNINEDKAAEDVTKIAAVIPENVRACRALNAPAANHPSDPS